ncbi:FAD-dependent oxidoreductase [Pseudomonas sp. JM0905a]|uniref:NAD(P)/FAD-dependent oxidoreductase n=1 Tax=Pseudomonas sp. JM0905a TaxID=2772484 RepID=UPI0016855157|nr:FAD-dependent oxidoreductase [Pseudomonas sp. JM0905a]MBD2837839.1 FAD-dependent oxidoreductase [Pseudomonas sp. JM0905a]
MDLQPALPGADSRLWSWWREDVNYAYGPASAVLTGTKDVDVAIIGGGFTGLWTALALRERAPHLSVALVEASRVGDGASSRNGGMVHGYWASLNSNAQSIGIGPALEIARLGSDAQDAIRKFANRPGVDVWWREEGSVRVATCPAQERKLLDYWRECEELGAGRFIQKISQAETRGMIDAPVFGSSLYFPEAANVHPGRLVLALRDAAVAAGVSIYEQSPVERIDEARIHSVMTKHGRLRAGHVVLATNVGLSSIPEVGARMSLFSSFATMSREVPDALSRLGWNHGVGASDFRMFLHYFRRTHDNRVLMGSGSGPIGFGSQTANPLLYGDEVTKERARRGMARLLPEVAQAGFAKSWGWPIDVSADRLPFFKTLRRGIYYGGGYSGHGVNATWIAGRCLSSLVLGVKDQWSQSPFCARKVPRLPPEPFKYIGANAIRWGILRCEEAEEVERRSDIAARGLAALPKLLGLRIGVR